MKRQNVKIQHRRLSDFVRSYRNLQKAYEALAEEKTNGQTEEKRILLVEDNHSNVEIAIEILKSMELSAEHAENGLEAVKLCENKPPDYFQLVLMDILMPIMDGYEAASILRGEMKMKASILAVTATVPDDHVVEENSPFVDGYILKPFRPDSFKAAIWKHLQ